MRDHLRELVRGLDSLVGRNVMREYLQARIMESLQRTGAMSALAFQGGTALRNVHSGWLRFRAVLHDVGLSPHRDEVLAVRLDVDTRPPAGAVTETRLVRRHVSLRIHHHDRASLLAGKLHAVLRRPWGTSMTWRGI